MLVVLVGINVCSAADEEAAQTTVTGLHQTLIDVMQRSETLGFAGRLQVLEPVIEASFDFDFISNLVTGRYWDSWEPSQQVRMVDVFTALIIATYAARFDAYDNHEFKIVTTRPLKKERVLVRSELVSADGDAVSLDYVLHQSAGTWKIINVVAEGVSDLSVKRADYATVLRSDGFDQLIDRIDAQIDKLAEGE